MSEQPRLRIRRRRLPHWTLDGSTYFVTFRTAQGQLPEADRRVVLTHLRSGEGRYYILLAAVVMADHVHLLISPGDGFSLSRIMKGIKGVSARLINQARGTTGHVWQDECWDRIIRDADEFEEKLNYMVNNPVDAGLVGKPEDYEFLYVNKDLV